ncbi:MAG: pantetheine-phosphate adenylyltransferase [Candidatus Daviesbacteria bacterium]|nr:pantetheine-phosphate adenylyltransferase [Candidatus Daviesbacteria bacterium]
MKFSNVVLGGTFDLLHNGHQLMLNKAFQSGRLAFIGLTTDQFNESRGKESFQNQNTRLHNLKAFLKQKNYLKRSAITLVNDIFGTTLEDPKLEAIVVTQENMHIVKLINQKRIAARLKPLQTILVPHLKDEEGRIISSTRIREGQIDSLGRSYKKLLLKIAGKKLNNHIREKLKKPLGKLLTTKTIPVIPAQAGIHLITVGDVTTLNLLKRRIRPNLSIVDQRIQRRLMVNWIPAFAGMTKGNIKIKNPPGQISRSLILAIDQAFKKILVPNSSSLVLFIDGEEDLATIPAILLSPLGTRVCYGQPNKGLVEVKVDLEIKDYLYKLLIWRQVSPT